MKNNQAPANYLPDVIENFSELDDEQEEFRDDILEHREAMIEQLEESDRETDERGDHPLEDFGRFLDALTKRQSEPKEDRSVYANESKRHLEMILGHREQIDFFVQFLVNDATIKEGVAGPAK